MIKDQYKSQSKLQLKFLPTFLWLDIGMHSLSPFFFLRFVSTNILSFLLLLLSLLLSPLLWSPPPFPICSLPPPPLITFLLFALLFIYYYFTSFSSPSSPSVRTFSLSKSFNWSISPEFFKSWNIDLENYHTL